VGFDEALKPESPQARTRLVEATVVEERPRLIFEVALPTQQKVLAHLVGVAKRNFVRLVPGDRVEVELSPHDPARGRIMRKL
jgi:translation initiation factor IF-1